MMKELKEHLGVHQSNQKAQRKKQTYHSSAYGADSSTATPLTLEKRLATALVDPFLPQA